MFERILIKSGSNLAERFISIADLVDMMFYYGEVHVVVSQFELKQLLEVFGEDVLYQLITTKRLILHPCDQHVGAARYGKVDSIGVFSRNFGSIDELLFNFHKETVNDSKENSRFADKFSKVLTEYKYTKDFQTSLYMDVENTELLTRATQAFIRQYYPSYQGIDDIKVAASPAESSFMNFYQIEGNLRFDELNTLHQQAGYIGEFNYSTILMSLGETHADCYSATDLQAELIANQRWSEIYKFRINESLSRAEGSKEQIDHFREMTVNEFLSPGKAFVEGLISPYDLLNDILSWDTYYFKQWLSTISEGQPLTRELYKDIQSQNSNKVWVKFFRTITQVVVGALNPIIGGGLTFLDGFVGDKIVNGWKPAVFVNNMLAKEEYKK